MTLLHKTLSCSSWSLIVYILNCWTELFQTRMIHYIVWYTTLVTVVARGRISLLGKGKNQLKCWATKPHGMWFHKLMVIFNYSVLIRRRTHHLTTTVNNRFVLDQYALAPQRGKKQASVTVSLSIPRRWVSDNVMTTIRLSPMKLR